MYQDSQVLNLNIDDILPNRFQPRIKFNEQAINELAESIKTHGVIQPIVVRKISDKYEIIAGERRYKASILAGKTTIPAIVASLDDKNSAEIALIENVQRQNLTPIEEAISYKKILDMGYLNQVSLAEKLGKTQSTIANKMRLLNLNEEVQEALMESKISERHARSLLRLKSDLQVVMLNRIINERLTVRKTDEEIEKLLSEENESETKELEGNNEMNNDILKEFNIPTEPIIEEFDTKLDQVSNAIENRNDVMQPMQSIDDSLTEKNETNQFEFSPINNNLYEQPKENIENSYQTSDFNTDINQPVQINPGFMDVEKIENQAEEIYKEPEPLADIDMLLNTSNNPVIEEPVSQIQMPLNEELESEPQANVGKFFTMFNMNEEESNSNFVSDIESKEVNMDFGVPTNQNNIFNFNPINETELNINQQQSIEFNNEPINNNVQNNLLNSLESNNESMQFNNSNEQISLESKIEQQSDLLTEIPQIEEIKENEDLDKTMEFSKPFESYSLTDDAEFTNNISKNIEEIPEIKQQDISISPNYPLENEITYDDMGEIEVKLPEIHQKLTAANFKTVINTIRECANTIEKYGFSIDTEEIDLEDSYQVIFRIDKK